ncbi:hypothetical protein ABZY16_32985, partial [Streptomyces sp. NPDC006553]
MDTPTPMDATDGFTARAFAAPAFTDEIPPGCACAGCARAARRTAADGARGMATLHGVRRAVVATVGAVALAGSA